jgi:hypothetical protein
MILAILAVVTATYAPPAPTVGDLITVEFETDVRLDESESYEIVSQEGSRAVIRTFYPKPLLLSGRAGYINFRGLPVVVRSVLEPQDDMAPAPLAPPVPVPYAREPFIAIAIAAGAALLAWLSVWWVTRPRETATMPLLPPDERFRRAVLALIDEPGHRFRWATLADETRLFLAATHPELRSDLTTREVVRLLSDDNRVVEEILRQGDLEKFSLRGAAPREFRDVAMRAVLMASPPPAAETSRETMSPGGNA